MQCPEIIKFAILFIFMGIFECVVFREHLLGYPLLLIGIIISVLEILDY